MLICLALTAVAYSQPVKEIEKFFPIDRGHSYIEFSIRYMGYAKVRGRFADFEGMVHYDDQDLSKMSVTMAIKTESIDTDHDFRDGDLKSDNWFDAKTYPVILFRSKKSEKTATGFKVIGDLTIKGTTKEVVLQLDKPSGILKDVRKDDQIIVTGTTRINRIDFGVMGKNWSAVKEGMTAVENDVDIEFSILGKQIKRDNFTNWVSSPDQPPGKLYKIATEQGTPAALAEFEKMRKENAVKERALSTVGYMLQLEGKMNDAISVLEANKAAFPDLPASYQELGEAYWRAGNSSKAKESLEASLQKNPQSAQTMELLRYLQ